MYKVPNNESVMIAVFFLCIALSIFLMVGIGVYLIWRRFCKKDIIKNEVSLSSNLRPSITSHTRTSITNQTGTDNQAQTSVTPEPAVAENTEEANPTPADVGNRNLRRGSGVVYTFTNECSSRPIAPNSYRQGDQVFAPPSTYRQNLSWIGRSLMTVEEVEETIDSPPSYEELFPSERLWGEESEEEYSDSSSEQNS